MVGLLASRAGSWSEAIFLTMLPWFSLGAVGAVIALIAVSAEPLGESHRRAAQTVAPIAISREDRGAFTLVRFGSDEPTACAIPGRSPEILISTALEEALTTAQLRAVVAHEYAHLRHRHGWAVRAAEINALCLPRALPAGRRLRKATLLLIELIADDIAAKQAGPANLANALVRIGRITADPTLDLRAERMTLRRWPVASRRRVPEPVRI
ncbi:Peptidase M48, Ste24p precursor [Gulosibacter sp. 10]|nr:Peptidase M48, Ste24p precursor [Gulosibacter sp. 10]